MIVMSFRTKKDKKHMLKKAKEMEEYVTELIECLEDAESRDEYDEDYEYSERGGMSTSMRGGRYNYRR
jgi:hypothetical protein